MESVQLHAEVAEVPQRNGLSRHIQQCPPRARTPSEGCGRALANLPARAPRPPTYLIRRAGRQHIFTERIERQTVYLGVVGLDGMRRMGVRPCARVPTACARQIEERGERARATAFPHASALSHKTLRGALRLCAAHQELVVVAHGSKQAIMERVPRNVLRREQRSQAPPPPLSSDPAAAT